jgi:hypothetical protein
MMMMIEMMKRRIKFREYDLALKIDRSLYLERSNTDDANRVPLIRDDAQ